MRVGVLSGLRQKLHEITDILFTRSRTSTIVETRHGRPQLFVGCIDACFVLMKLWVVSKFSLLQFNLRYSFMNKQNERCVWRLSRTKANRVGVAFITYQAIYFFNHAPRCSRESNQASARSDFRFPNVSPRSNAAPKTVLSRRKLC